MNGVSNDCKLMLLHGPANEQMSALGDPHPTGLATLVEHESVGRHRSLLCDHYDGCLDEAFRQRWTSWTCELCGLFALQPVRKLCHITHEAGLRPSA